MTEQQAKQMLEYLSRISTYTDNTQYRLNDTNSYLYSIYNSNAQHTNELVWLNEKMEKLNNRVDNGFTLLMGIIVALIGIKVMFK